MNTDNPTKNPYTAEEMASPLFQTAPVEAHVYYTRVDESPDSYAAPASEMVVFDVDARPKYEGDMSVGYVRRDIYEAVAQRVAELEQQVLCRE